MSHQKTQKIRLLYLGKKKIEKCHLKQVLANIEDFLLSCYRSKEINEVDSNDLDFELFKTKQVQIKPGRGTLLQFIITPLKIGLHNLKVTAKSTLGQDILIKTLNVQAEGDTLSANIPVFIDLRSATSMERNITVTYWHYSFS